MLLENWFVKHKRSFPWRDNPTPYRVWVSEVMLQQTRAQVVIGYFERWMQNFPTIQSLTEAPLESVIKSWEGLGYYSRARNLHVGAQLIVKKYGGNLPSSREELLQIPGLGPYTAGAILSFGFHQRAIAIDGNVARVISRYAWIDEEISKVSARRKIESFVDRFLHPEQPWITAEALIELGATVCTPAPRCRECPIRQHCMAYAKGQVSTLPIKAAGPKVEKMIRAVAIVEYQQRILVRKNPVGQLMADLWEFPYFEGVRTLKGLQLILAQWLKADIQYLAKLNVVEHSFTRFSARLFPFRFRIEEFRDVKGYRWIEREDLQNFPFSSGHRRILRQM